MYFVKMHRVDSCHTARVNAVVMDSVLMLITSDYTNLVDPRDNRLLIHVASTATATPPSPIMHTCSTTVGP